MSNLITEPGIYDVAIEDYHGREICDAPSISSSGLRAIINECPLKYWHGSCLNPNREEVETKPLIFGKAAHEFMVFGESAVREKFFIIPDDLNLNSKEGRAAKEQSAALSLPLMRENELQSIKEMAMALEAHPFAIAAFKNCEFEKTLVWKDEETGVWLRTRPDVLPNSIGHIPEYKTTVSAKPEDFKKSVWNYGYHMQAEFNLMGIEAVTGVKPKSFLFVAQEKKAPYCVSVFVLDQSAREWARIQLRKAIHTFAECLESGHWPSYAEDIVEIGLPGYAEYELTRRDSDGLHTIEEKAA